ncbi:LA_2272/LA_2273 family lipoprotein [Leptospira mayottensis]|uniref:LA_2272/LA_2273 family lipoprotein n=1 Tax=Leptospira mayottensis TaxID=1137606 RepID=UPI000E35C43E|nr:hypothetical protein [Leptospira mayottensis]AXR69002.1 hypothetical protein DPV73_14285 [Leptospira mayottensis]
MKKFALYVLFLFVVSILFFDCGVALTPKTTVKIPPKTNIEVFRLNIFHGEVENLYGLNLGIVNIIKGHMIGTQIGLLNSAESESRKKNLSLQIGILNNSDNNYYGVKFGIFNVEIFRLGDPMPGSELEKERKKIGAVLSIGLFNTMGGFNIGILNSGSVFNLGIVNFGETGFNVGIVNFGEEKQFQIGVLNFCKNGPVPIMIVVNYCRTTPSENSSTNEKISDL